MQVFQTKRQIALYLKEKAHEMMAYGYRLYAKDYDYYGCTATWAKGAVWNNTIEIYISVLLYSKHVGKGILKAVQEYQNKPIITMKSCGIADYLKKHNIPHIVIGEENDGK